MYICPFFLQNKNKKGYLQLKNFIFIAHLNPCRIKWTIHILVGRYKNYIFKPLKSFFLWKLIKIAWFKVTRWVVVSHFQLLQGLAFLPSFQKPHTSIDYRRGIKHVAEVWGGQSNKITHFWFVFQQVRKCCSADKAAHAITKNRNFCKTVSWTVLVYMSVYFLGEVLSHLSDISFRVLFIYLGL